MKTVDEFFAISSGLFPRSDSFCCIPENQRVIRTENDRSKMVLAEIKRMTRRNRNLRTKP